MFKWQAVFVVSLALALAAKPARGQVSRLPQAIQKKLAEINPLYQSNIRKYGPQTIELFTPLLAAGPKDGVSVTTDQAYGTDSQQTLDVYQPRGEKDLPVVVFVHGGALTTGDKNENKEVHANVLYYFARHQFLGINANYRLAPKYVYPAAAQDIGRAVAWIKENAVRFGGDPQRIYLIGRSTGALHVATWAFDPKIYGATGPGVSGVVLISGRLKADNRADDPNGQRVEEYFGKDTSLYAERSPVNFARSPLPTFIVIAEFDNPFLDVYSAELFAKMCEARSKCPRFLRLAGHNHQSTTLSINTGDDQLGHEIIDFIRQGK
jgi:acetyl esterase